MRHFNELRWRLILFLLLVGCTIVSVYSVSETAVYWLLLPLKQDWIGQIPHVVTQNVTELFTTYIYVSIWIGFLLCLPVLLFHLERFLSPGLYVGEKLWFRSMLVCSAALFYAGVLFAWLVLMPNLLIFFLGFNQSDVITQVVLAGYLEFLFKLMLLVGLVFNTPVLLIMFMKLGLVQLERLQRMRRFIVVAIFIIAALVTPPDPLSQLLLAIPMWVLYELTLVVAKFLKL